MRYPWVNTILLILLMAQLITGVAGLIAGSEQFSWVLWLHGIGGYALAVLIYWKSAIIIDVFKRRWHWNVARVGFIILTILLLITLATGFLWSAYGPIYLSGFSLIVLHGFVACGLIAFLLWHTIAKWYVWRIPAARNRRAFLRLGGLAVVGLAWRQVVEPGKVFAALPGATRRFTGSYEVGSFTGIFPATSWLFDRPRPIPTETWHLTVTGAVERPLRLTYAEVLDLSQHTHTALLDCTGGFYTTQAWQGIWLKELLEWAGVHPEAQSVTIEAVSGYDRRFSLATARAALLATHVAAQPLSHGHGAPLRLVVPGYRGFDWVKWVSHIRVNTTSHLWQPPLPLE